MLSNHEVIRESNSPRISRGVWNHLRVFSTSESRGAQGRRYTSTSGSIIPPYYPDQSSKSISGTEMAKWTDFSRSGAGKEGVYYLVSRSASRSNS
jgi:hypothetical protein